MRSLALKKYSKEHDSLWLFSTPMDGPFWKMKITKLKNSMKEFMDAYKEFANQKGSGFERGKNSPFNNYQFDKAFDRTAEAFDSLSIKDSVNNDRIGSPCN